MQNQEKPQPFRSVTAAKKSPGTSNTTAEQSAPKDEQDIGKCRTVPVQSRAVLLFLSAVRSLPQFRFISATEPINSSNFDLLKMARDSANWTPVDFYKVLFQLEPDVRVVGRVSRLLDEQRKGIVKGERQFHDTELSGYIYCFHYLADPGGVVKIGRTQRDPDVRRAEWERTLGAEPGTVLPLFAYKTVANKFAELIIHAVFTCEHEVARINPNTHEELDEFFLIDNIMALKKCVARIVAYINRFSLYYRRVRRRG